MSKRIPEASPIILSAPSMIEGNFKTNKSLRIECTYQGAVISSGKVYLSENAQFNGDLVCDGVTIDGSFKGDIYCTGKVQLNASARIEGRIYSKLFENSSNENLDCTIRIPSESVVRSVQERLEAMDLALPLSKDSLLNTIVEDFTKMPTKIKRIADYDVVAETLRVVERKVSLK
ncbi:MAG: bactofilin family protein [Flavobacteriaceae bacterium]